MSKQAIDAKRSNVFLIDPKDLTIIGLDTTDGPEHPLHDERTKLPIDQAKVKNVIARGILEPILVSKDGDRILVVNGRQRVRWARAANELIGQQGGETVLVPCMVKRGDDSDLIAIMSSSNLSEAEGMVSKAKKAQRYMDRGHDVEDCAIQFGVTETCVRNWQKLLDLAPGVRKAVEEGRLSASAAAKLAPLPRAEQEDKLDGLVQAGKKVTTRRATAAAKDASLAPGKRRIRMVADRLGTSSEAKILGWVLGEISDLEIGKALPKVGEALKQIEG